MVAQMILVHLVQVRILVGLFCDGAGDFVPCSSSLLGRVRGYAPCAPPPAKRKIPPRRRKTTTVVCLAGEGIACRFAPAGGGSGDCVSLRSRRGIACRFAPAGGLRVASLPQGEGAGIACCFAPAGGGSGDCVSLRSRRGIACRFAPAGGRERERGRGLLSRRGWPMSYIAPTPLLKIASRNKGMYINGDFIRLPNKINFSFQAFLEYSAASAS